MNIRGVASSELKDGKFVGRSAGIDGGARNVDRFDVGRCEPGIDGVARRLVKPGNLGMGLQPLDPVVRDGSITEGCEVGRDARQTVHKDADSAICSHGGRAGGVGAEIDRIVEMTQGKELDLEEDASNVGGARCSALPRSDRRDAAPPLLAGLRCLL